MFWNPGHDLGFVLHVGSFELAVRGYGKERPDGACICLEMELQTEDPIVDTEGLVTTSSGCEQTVCPGWNFKCIPVPVKCRHLIRQAMIRQR